jgi:hypothetical protein
MHGVLVYVTAQNRSITIASPSDQDAENIKKLL